MNNQNHEPLVVQLNRFDARMSMIHPGGDRIARRMDHISDDLRRTAATRQALTIGDRAPDFELPTQNGQMVSLESLRKAGPIVLAFYLGGWSPYCRLQFRALQDAQPEFKQLGANLVAVSPQPPAESAMTARKEKWTFPLLSDVANRISVAFGITFNFPITLQAAYGRFKLPGGDPNPDAVIELPLPAIFIIDSGGCIRYAFVQTDLRSRTEPADIIDALATLYCAQSNSIPAARSDEQRTIEYRQPKRAISA